MSSSPANFWWEGGEKRGSDKLLPHFKRNTAAEASGGRLFFHNSLSCSYGLTIANPWGQTRSS